jgi:hypothetical protein
MLPAGSGVAVVIWRSLTLMVKDGDVAIAPVESVTLIVNAGESPVTVGVPVMVTEFVVLAPRDSPAGNAPLAMAQVNGGTPPEAFTVAL